MTIEYTARPCDVTAMRFTGTNTTAILNDLCGMAGVIEVGEQSVDLHLHDETNGIELVVHPGEWIVRPDVTRHRQYFKMPDEVFRLMYFPTGMFTYRVDQVNVDGVS